MTSPFMSNIPGDAGFNQDLCMLLTSFPGNTGQVTQGIPQIPIQAQTPVKLEIVEQKSLAQERISSGSIPRNIHIVVKNAAFEVSVRLTGKMHMGKIVDFNTVTVVASLLFDCDGDKEVPYFKQRPVEYRGHVNDRADVMTMNVKIRVLTSHCENMLFRLKLACVDPQTNTPLEGLMVQSEPIKVISKPDQLKKKGAKVTRRKRTTRKRKPTKAVKGKEEEDRPTKKTRTDEDNTAIMESLQKLMEIQMENKTALANLQKMGEDTTQRRKDKDERNRVEKEKEIQTQVARQQEKVNAFANLELDSFTNSLLCLPDSGSPAPSGGGNFVQVFNNLLDIYSQLTPEQRSEEVRKAIRFNPSRKLDSFGEMIAMFNDEGLEKPESSFRMSGDGSIKLGGTCLGKSCAHKKELDKIEQFYSSFQASSQQPSLGFLS